MTSFSIEPQKIANYFTCTIDRDAGDSITHLKLQKLLYYAQAWSMVIFNKSLFEEDFQAWAHGPVLPSIWEGYKEYGYDAIPICSCDHDLPKEIAELMEDVKRTYGEKSGKSLERLTHSEWPWIDTRGDLEPEARSNKPIPKDLMKEFYSSLRTKADEDTE